MGASSNSLISAIELLENETRCNSNGLEIGLKRGKRPKRVLRARLEGSGRPRNIIVKRIRTLRKLIPNKNGLGLDGLFQDTADYILSLQMKVRVMQIMLRNLSTNQDE